MIEFISEEIHLGLSVNQKTICAAAWVTSNLPVCSCRGDVESLCVQLPGCRQVALCAAAEVTSGRPVCSCWGDVESLCVQLPG